jgi:hypothetical protein
MRRKEIFLIVILILFGLLYHLYKTGEEDVFISCSNGSRNLLDKEHLHEFAGIKSVYDNIRVLEIENPAGNIQIGRSNGSQVEVKWIKQIYHRNENRVAGIREEIDVRPSQINGRLKFEAISKGAFPYRRARIVFNVLIPEGVELQLMNRYGDIDIEKTEKNVTIDNKYGNIMAKDIGAEMRIRHGYGQVVLERIKGSLIVVSKYSTVKISDTQALEIEGRHTRMQLFGIKRGIRLTNTHDSIELSDVKGDVDLNARHCRIKLLNIDSRYLIVKNSYNNVNIENLWAREADFVVSHGNLNIEFFEVEDQVNIRGKHSDILLNYTQNLNPSFNINLTYGKIINTTSLKLEGVKGKYKQEFAGQAGKPEIIINNKYGNVKLMNSENVPVE